MGKHRCDTFEQVIEATICHRSFLKAIFQRQHTFTTSLYETLTMLTVHCSSSTAFNRQQTEEMEKYIITHIHQLDIPDLLTSISKCNWFQLKNYVSMVFNDFLFFIWTLAQSFISKRNNRISRHDYTASALLIKETIPIIIQKCTNRSSKSIIVQSYSIHNKKWKQIDIFPYSRFILRCLHTCPSSDLDHHFFYWKHVKLAKDSNLARTETKMCLTFLKRFCNNNVYVLKLVLRKLRNICLHNDDENRYVGSLPSTSIILSNSIRHYCKDLDYMHCCLDFFQLLLRNSRNRLTFENVSESFVLHTNYFGFCGIQCIAELNIAVYTQMCELKERLFPFEFSNKQKEEYTAARCAGLYNLSLSTKIFFKDPDFSPLLAVLATYISGEEELRAEFRRLGIRNIISNTLQTSHNNPAVSENCYKVIDTATDGKSENVILLFEDNENLKYEIQYALRNFREIPGICLRVISIMTKLLKADSDEAKWMDAEEVQDQITKIAEHHRSIVNIDSACSQLMILLKYFGCDDSGFRTEKRGHVEPSRNPQSEGNRNPRKSRL